MKLTRFNDNTITTKKAYIEELDDVRKLGYALDREEELIGVVCLGTPVLDQYSYPVAAIWITGPTDRMPASQFIQIGKLVKQHAMTISRRLGYGMLSEELC